MRIPFIWLDYARDDMYAFGQSYYLPLDIGYARSIIDIFGLQKPKVSTTKQLLEQYEDHLSSVPAFRSEWEGDHRGECPDDHPDLIWAREEFRKDTAIVKDWPLSQLLFSAVYRLLIEECCPYQEAVWNLTLNRQVSGGTRRTKQITESLFSENPDRGLFLVYGWTADKLQKMKGVKTTDNIFWSILFFNIFLGENQALSLEVMDLFLSFANRHPGFKREIPALVEAFLNSIKRKTFPRDFPENPLFFSFIYVPLFQYMGISTLRSQIAFLKYAETKNICWIENLFKGLALQSTGS